VELRCKECERLSLAAHEASMAYYAIQAELESAHIDHQNARTLHLRLLVDKAFLNRKGAIEELSTHEQIHLRNKSIGV